MKVEARQSRAKKPGLRCGRTRRPPGYGWHGVYFCSVGRAFTPAVPGCLTRPLFGCDGVWSMRRGGIDAARRNTAGVGRLRFAGCVFCLVGRAFTPAEPIKFLKFFNVRRGQDPALQTGGNGQRTGNPARRAPLPGGIYASPTNKATAYTSPKTVPQGKRPRAAYMRPLQTGREWQVNG